MLLLLDVQPGRADFLDEVVALERWLREPDVGFTWATWRWASGDRLEKVLDDDPDMTAGDFVRWCKQLIDLLGQIALVAGDSPVRATSRQAMDAVRRGVVAYSSVV